MSIRVAAIACLLVAPALAPAVTLAQPPAAPAQVKARAATGGGLTARVVTRWEASGSGSGRLLVEGGGQATRLYQGGGGAATIVGGHGVLLVAYQLDVAREPFRVRVVRSNDGQPAIGDEVRISRPVARRDMPFSVVGAATPDGFTVLFQEIQADDPSAAHTYMKRFDRVGRPVGALTEVPIPWGLADALWNGSGYHLALIFPGGGQGMRLSMVSTTPELQPQQHPDWASAAGFIDDVHLVQTGERILAFYRGGAGDRIYESDVTQIRGWGGEPPPARSHGAIDGDHIIDLRRDGGAVRVVRVSAE